jgi:ATP-dependent helicase/nuclease subunit B
VQIRQAIGEVNEIRNVLRQCVAGQLRFDDVELLHTDMATYVPLVYETLSALAREGETLGDDLPVTFAEGIPCRYSRPGRALTMWLAWIVDGYPQATLVQLLREGLLEVLQPDEQSVSFSRISGLLRAVGIGFGRDRYARHLIEKIIGLEHQLATGDGTTDEEGEPIPGRIQALRRDLRDYQALAAFVDVLLACSPADPADHAALLAGATKFLKSHARSVSQIDRFSVLRLAADIEDMGQWVSEDGQASVDAWEWLAKLPDEARVLGSGPRPGCLHVAHAFSGGHTGRPHAFIVGLDDSRFPGAGMQDPLLLDIERAKLSGELPTAASRLDDKVRDFIRLLARLRGHVTLSYCAQGVSEDREMFPSGVILSAFRLVSGQRTADHSDLQRWLTKQGPAASFAPAYAIESVSAAEWWLWRLCGAETAQDPEQVVLAQHPHLARGLHGANRRRSSEFTEYDGRVEAAGADLDPTQMDHRVLSPNRLQKIGKCSLMYFFEYGLGIAPPQDIGVDRNVWLDPQASGLLLHEVFERFMRELLTEKRSPDHKRDEPRIRELLAERIGHYLDLHPSPSEGVFQRQQAELEQAVLTFLREEEHYCRSEHSRPAYLEASLGMESEEHSTPLDTLDAIPVPLDGGRHVRLRGRIDRIDLVGDGAVKTFRIWDYKTGSTYGYDRANAFQQGRVLQPFLYVTMVAHRVREVVDPGAEVSHFGFFFPGRKARGERIEWSQQDLADGPRILARLVQIVTNGAFLATNDAKDCKFCGYLGICGDTERVTSASAMKLEIVENQLLAPMRDLRNG